MQKKFTLAIIAAFLFHAGFSQFKQGTTNINFNVGNIGDLRIRNKEHSKYTSLFFNPGFGYFIKDNWEIGASVTFKSYNINDTAHAGLSEKSKVIGLAAYTNYYFGTGRFKPYVTFQVGWNHGYGQYSFNSGSVTSFKTNYFHSAIGGGFNWSISPKVSIFLEGSYWKDRPLNRYGYSRFNLTTGMKFFLNTNKSRK